MHGLRQVDPCPSSARQDDPNLPVQELAAPQWVSMVQHAGSALGRGCPEYWALWPGSSLQAPWGALVATFYKQACCAAHAAQRFT